MCHLSCDIFDIAVDQIPTEPGQKQLFVLGAVSLLLFFWGSQKTFIHLQYSHPNLTYVWCFGLIRV